MDKLQYTHKQMVVICDESKRLIISQLKEMIGRLDSDVSGECVWLSDINNCIDEIEKDNGIKDKLAQKEG